MSMPYMQIPKACLLAAVVSPPTAKFWKRRKFATK